MNKLRTIDDILYNILRPEVEISPPPPYSGDTSKGVVMGVESMKRHMTDEGWQIVQALEYAGYTTAGKDLTVNEVDVKKILSITSPGVVVLQDKREWDIRDKNDFRDKTAEFLNVTHLERREDLFKLTILKDGHNDPEYHKESADEIGCHAWIVYYHPRIVQHVAPFVRPENLIRTYHSIDPKIVPEFVHTGRSGASLSGEIRNAYPFRRRIVNCLAELDNVHYLKHPGYHMLGTATPSFLRYLTKFKVAICTSSKYGYALRKIVEATASGCRVITDLPLEDPMPAIDMNLVRVSPSIEIGELNKLINTLCDSYDSDRQEDLSKAAVNYYDYRVQGTRMTEAIEKMRKNYGNLSTSSISR